jgi:hypothetical protein
MLKRYPFLLECLSFRTTRAQRTHTGCGFQAVQEPGACKLPKPALCAGLGGLRLTVVGKGRVDPKEATYSQQISVYKHLHASVSPALKEESNSLLTFRVLCKDILSCYCLSAWPWFKCFAFLYSIVTDTQDRSHRYLHLPRKKCRRRERLNAQGHTASK